MTRICDAITRFVREHPIRTGCTIALTIILAFGVGYTAHFWDKLTLAERAVIPVVGGIGGVLSFWALLKRENQTIVHPPLLSKQVEDSSKVISRGNQPASVVKSSQVDPPASLPSQLSKQAEEESPIIITEVNDPSLVVASPEGERPVKRQVSFDRAQLHADYLKRHKGKVRKIRPLKLVKVEEREGLEKIKAKLDEWQAKAKQCVANCAQFLRQNEGLDSEKEERVLQERARFTSLFLIASQINGIIDRILEERSSSSINVAFDDEGNLQAVSVTYSVDFEGTECIAELISAPQNIKSEIPQEHLAPLKKSEGAAAALIAEAVFKNLKKGEEARGVILIPHLSAIPYYAHLGFIQIDPLHHGLRGEKLTQFISNYGGRVHPSQALT